MSESLTLKWGTLKAWDLNEDGPALEALNRYHEEPTAWGAAQQRDTETQKEALIEVIEHLDAEFVYNDWTGKEMTKEEAKQYVREYRR